MHPKAYSDDMGHYVRLYLAAEIEVCDLLVHPPGKDFRLVHPCVPWPNDGSQHLPRVAKVPVTKQTVCLMRWRLQGGELLDQGPFSALCVCFAEGAFAYLQTLNADMPSLRNLYCRLL